MSGEQTPDMAKISTVNILSYTRIKSVWFQKCLLSNIFKKKESYFLKKTYHVYKIYQHEINKFI